jgi:1-acyl-sn-glycerol-3-phosphate acyltransferase
MMKWFATCIPPADEQYTHQTQLHNISGQEFAAACKPPEFKKYHRVFQVACFIVFLGPVRVVAFGILGALCALLVVWIRLVVAFLGFHPDACKGFCANIARLSFRLFLFSLGNVWIRARGDFERSARFIIANHISILDAFVIAILRPVTTEIDKRWSRSFLLRTFLDNANPVYVAHGDGNTKEIVDRADDGGRFPVLLFPEEAQTNGDVMLRFHRKAFVTPYKVQPVVIRYWLFLVPKGWNTVVSGDLWRLLAVPFFVIDVDFLQSIAMEVEGKAGIKTFTQNAQIMLANYLKVKAVSRTSDEMASAVWHQ